MCNKSEIETETAIRMCMVSCHGSQNSETPIAPKPTATLMQTSHLPMEVLRFSCILIAAHSIQYPWNLIFPLFLSWKDVSVQGHLTWGVPTLTLTAMVHVKRFLLPITPCKVLSKGNALINQPLPWGDTWLTNVQPLQLINRLSQPIKSYILCISNNQSKGTTWPWWSTFTSKYISQTVHLGCELLNNFNLNFLLFF